MPRGRRGQYDSRLPQSLISHARACVDSACGCKTVAWNYLSWRLELLIHCPEQALDQESWYAFEITSDGRFSSGCLLCKYLAMVGFQFCTAQQCRLSHLRRHAESRVHLRCLEQLAGRTPSPESPASPVGAPSLEHFQRVLTHIQQGNANATLPGIAARHKIARMEFVLVESLRCIWREALRRAVSINILRDERHKRCLILFRCTNADLEITEGVLGQAKMFYSSSALGLSETTLRIIRDFCTPSDGRQMVNRPECDTELFAHIRHTVHCATVDAASNEVTAAKDMANPLVTDAGGLHAGETMFPCYRLTVRDRAHEFRRILSRPWHADPYLDVIITSLITGPNSITQLIQRSDDFRSWYAQASKSSQTKIISSNFRNMRAALHRYESLVTPLSRFVLDIDAVLAVAVRICEERAGDRPAHCAAHFLKTLDAEMVLTVGLLADAGDDAMEIIRYFDQSHVDSATVSRKLRNFEDRITDLFFNGKIIGVDGHTRVVQDWLATSHVYQVNGEVLSIGGPLAVNSVVGKCMQRLRAWAVLAREVIHAEFPSFDVMNSMRIFDVSSTCMHCQWRPGMTLPDTLVSDITRLGQTFTATTHYDAKDLMQQWADFQPRAVHHHNHSGCTNIEAWRRALSEVSTRRETNMRHPCDELLKVLAPYACISLSDSAIERSFSGADQRIPAQARSMTEGAESIRMTALAMKLEQVVDMMPKVMEVWGELYPQCRNGGFNRIDQGKARAVVAAQKNEKLTEREFIKRRRLAASSAIVAGAALDAPAAGSVAVCGESWTPRHVAEGVFNRQKQHDRLIEAVVSSSLLHHEMDDALITEAIETLNKNSKNRAKRARREQKVTTKGRIPRLEEFRGQRVFISDLGRTPDLDECISVYYWDVVNMETASLLVAPMVSEQMLQCAMLNGAWVVHPDWASALRHGAPYQRWAVKYCPATATKRLGWISPAAQADAAATVRAAAAQPSSKWTIAASIDDWVVRKQVAKDQKNPSSVIALVSDAEEKSFEAVGHVFKVVRFFEFVGRLDREQTTNA